METDLDHSPIHSEFRDDPDYADLLKTFGEELPLRIKALQDAFAQRDFAQLKNLAHQLKGSGGGYGFPQLSTAAGKLEQICIDQNEPLMKANLEVVLNVLKRISC